MLRTPTDPTGYDEAFRGLYVKAYNVARRISGSAVDAEDIAAETMARALASWRRVGSLPHRDAWIQRVAANVAIDALRKRSPQIHGAAPEMPDDHVGTLERLIVRDGLSRLSRRQRDVLALRYLADMPEAEVAAALNLSPGSVKRHAHRGAARLRLLLSPDDPEVEVAY